jgi:DNA-binding transcriptional regulator YiaG
MHLRRKTCRIYKISLTASVGFGEKYPKELNTLGDHIRAMRLERGMLQREVADMIGVCKGTIIHWENNKGGSCAPDVPAIIKFLGYDPFPDPGGLINEMKQWRVRSGLSTTEAAGLLGMEGATWAYWEQGARKPGKRTVKAILALISEPRKGTDS